MRILFLACLMTISIASFAQRGRPANRSVSILTALSTPGVQDNVMLTMPNYPATPRPHTALADIRNIADLEMADMRRERRVYQIGQDRIREYCIGNCACLARDIIPLLRARGYTTRRFNIIRGLNIRTPSGQSPYYDFHAVTAVQVNGQWWVLDPVVLASTQLERMDVWIDRIIPNTITVGRVY